MIVMRALSMMSLGALLAVASGCGNRAEGGGSSGTEATTDEATTGDAPTGGSTGEPDPVAAMMKICEQYLACECPDHLQAVLADSPYMDLDACLDAWLKDEETLKATAAENGLEYDPGCFAVTADKYAAAGCMNSRYYPDQSCDFGCQPIHGALEIGSPCQPFTLDDGSYSFLAGIDFSACAPGLRCDPDDQICVAVCGDEGEACGKYGVCAEGLFCATASHACTPLFTEGESCMDEIYSCAAGLYCRESDSVCTAYKEEGKSCDDNDDDVFCGEGLSCHDVQLMCVPRTPPGGSCEDVGCVEGAFCSDDGITAECNALTPTGAPCEDDWIFCAEDGTCIDNVCVPFPPYICVAAT